MHPRTGTETVRAVRPIGGVEVYLYSFLTKALEGVKGQRHASAAIDLPGKTRYPLYRRLGGPQDRSGQVCGKSRLPLGFDPRTVQPVGSRYTDYATRPKIIFSASV